MVALSEAYQLFQAGAEALTLVEEQGIRIDTQYCREKLVWIDRKILQAEMRLKGSKLGKAWAARFGSAMRLSSGPQLRAVLYADLHAKPFKKSDGGEDSVDEESLRATNVDGIIPLLQTRRFKKAKDVLNGFLRYAINDKLYPSFSLHTVATYRSSSSEPNLQNVPKRDKEIMDICRQAIIPSPGNMLVEIDFSGIEVAIATTYHKDPAMIKYLLDDTSDMHADMAHEIYSLPRFNQSLKDIPGGSNLRQSSKNGFVFPEFYGDYYESCAFNIACNWMKMPQHGLWKATHGMEFNGAPIGKHLLDVGYESLGEFTNHIKKVEDDFWNKRFKVYNAWRKAWYGKYQQRGWFDMQTGFRVSGLYAKNQVINYPVQGSAFHCLLWLLIELVNELRACKSKVICEIHDSVLLDVYPPEYDTVIQLARYLSTTELVQQWPWINVPMRVEVAVSEIDEPWSAIKVVG